MEHADLIPSGLPPGDGRPPAMSMAEAWTYGYPGPLGSDRSQETGLLGCWRILKRRKLVLALCALTGFGLAYLYTRAQAPVYQARASVEILDLNVAFPSIARTTQESQPWVVLSDLQTQIRLLESEGVALTAMTKVKDDAERSGRVFPAPLSPLSLFLLRQPLLRRQPPEQRDVIESQLAAVAGNFKVRSAGDSRILEVLADSTDPQLAADYANAVVREYVDLNTGQRRDQNARNSSWLREQLEDVRQQLARSEYNLQQYAQENGLLFTGGGAEGGKANVSEEKLRQVQQALSEARADRILKQSRQRSLTSSSPDALTEVMNDPSLRELRSKITDLRRQLAELSSVYTQDFGKVKRLQGQLQALEASFARERDGVIERIRNEYMEAVVREELLVDDYTTQARTVSRESEKAIQYQLLSHEVDSYRQVYDSMLQRVKQAGIDAALKSSNVRLVDTARPPRIPYKPRTRLTAALGMLLGLFAGAVFVVAAERADRSIKSPGETVNWLDVPELGVVPSGAGRSLTTSRPFKKHSVTIMESFRMVMTSILISGQNGSGWRTLVCTSSSAAEGKTTVAANLGMALARIGRRVLLIDADLSRPMMHDVFGISNEHGLASLLESASLSDEAIQAAIHETGYGVYVLPAGPPSVGASDLLFATHMPELLERLEMQFDAILIDTPPTPQMSHARLLGRISDGVVLVVRAGRTSRESLSAAVQRFATDRIRVVGTVLNGWDPRRSPSDYYSSATVRYARPRADALARAVEVVKQPGSRRS